MAQALCYSNAEWLNKQIDYARQQFRHAYQEDNQELKNFWCDRWDRLERHYKELRGV